MKILFINAQDTRGGGAIAAYRLGLGLEKYHGTENLFVVAKKHSTDSNIFCTRKNDFQWAVEVIIDKIMNRLGFQYKYFPFSPRAILKKAREFKPDIISCHNIHEGYFETRDLIKLSKIAPIAWTLHDMWSFTANAGNTFGDDSWKRMKSGNGEKKIYPHLGLNTGNLLLRLKRRIYRKSDLTLITPSRWMTEMVSQAPVFKGKDIRYITHGIDLNTFKSRSIEEKAAARKALGIDPMAKVMIFISAGELAICPWKGGPLLIDILKSIDSKIDKDFPVEAILMGKGKLNNLGLKQLKIHHIGFVESESLMSMILSAADVMIYPTKADSLGLVLVESIACGVPAVSFDIGGCGDVIKDNLNGYMIPPFQVETFVEKTMFLLTDSEKYNQFSKAAREYAEQHFDICEIAGRHYELFQSIISRRRT